MDLVEAEAEAYGRLAVGTTFENKHAVQVELARLELARGVPLKVKKRMTSADRVVKECSIPGCRFHFTARRHANVFTVTDLQPHAACRPSKRRLLPQTLLLARGEIPGSAHGVCSYVKTHFAIDWTRKQAHNYHRAARKAREGDADGGLKLLRDFFRSMPTDGNLPFYRWA